MQTSKKNAAINLAAQTPESECLEEFNSYLLTFWDWQMEMNNTTLELLRVREGNEYDHSAATYRRLIEELQSKLFLLGLELRDFDAWMELNEVPVGNVA